MHNCWIKRLLNEIQKRNEVYIFAAPDSVAQLVELLTLNQ